MDFRGCFRETVENRKDDSVFKKLIFGMLGLFLGIMITLMSSYFYNNRLYSGELIIIQDTPKVYHRDDCILIKNNKFLFTFSSSLQAVRKGFRPCNSCKSPYLTENELIAYENETKNLKKRLNEIIQNEMNTYNQSHRYLQYEDDIKYEKKGIKTIGDLLREQGFKDALYITREDAIERIKNNPKYEEFKDLLQNPEYSTKK